MSIPKKTREVYNDTLQKLINTSKDSIKIKRQILNNSFLPLKLSDTKTKLFPSLEAVTKPTPQASADIKKIPARKINRKKTAR